MAADLGTATTVTFGTSAFAFELLDVSGSGNLSREAIDVTHMGSSSFRAFMPSDLKDGGEFSLQGHYGGLASPPVASTGETITIAWGGTTDTWAFPGFMTEYTPGAPLEDKMTFSATIKVAGAITLST